MSLSEEELEIPAAPAHRNALEHVSRAVASHLDGDETPVRFVLTASDEARYRCEIGILAGTERRPGSSIFRFARRQVENTSDFNAVLLVPTGIGARIGGHAGDATPVATLLATACDTLVTHPNVLNASDIIDIPPNALYVEGSVISRLLMGAAGLQRVRSNRLLVVIEAHDDELFANAAVNAVNAARASYGLVCPRVVHLDPKPRMTSRYAASGRATGTVEGMDALIEVLDEHRNEYDAIAISSVISVPQNYHTEYFESEGDMVNPWGGVEAMLTHSLSGLYDVPSAHSPMMETRDIANMDPGIVDPRMAAEAVSLTFLQCILKGLQRSPRIVSDAEAMRHRAVLTAADVACLVIPDGCIGLPTLAALEQGIAVIAVRENQNLMSNDLAALPWSPGQLHIVDNYWEAAGVMAALRAGIDPRAVRRPLLPALSEKTAPRVPSRVEALSRRLLLS